MENVRQIIQNGIFRSLAFALESGLKHLVVLLAKDSGVHLAGCAASQYNMWMPFKKAYPDRVHLLLRKDDAFVHSKMMIVDDVYQCKVSNSGKGSAVLCGKIERGGRLLVLGQRLGHLACVSERRRDAIHPHARCELG